MLYAVATGSDLAQLTLPPGWSYSTRALREALAVDSNGFLEAYSDLQGNLWQKLEAR